MHGLEIRDLRLHYPLADGGRLPVLEIGELCVPAKAAVGITGPSGSGKSSLLYVLCGLTPPQQGSVSWGKTEITALSEGERDRWRRETVGLVFQDFHLFSGMSTLQNVLLPVSFDRLYPSAALTDRARALLTRVGVRGGLQPVETLSRGEMQRVAVARALLFTPRIVLADEPTASLDAGSGRLVGDLLLEVCREAGSTLLIVSHDPALLRRLDLVHTLINGRLDAGEPSGPPC